MEQAHTARQTERMRRSHRRILGVLSYGLACLLMLLDANAVLRLLYVGVVLALGLALPSP